MSHLVPILLVEDDPNDIELTFLALAEYRVANPVVSVQDGAEALDYLYRRGAFAGRPEGLPALILLDIRMPRVSGMELLRQIRSDPELRAIPVVMLTASHDEPDLSESYRLGVHAYVVKPVGFPALANAIRELQLSLILLEGPPGGQADMANHGATTFSS